MNAMELQVAVLAFQKSIGPKADVTLFLSQAGGEGKPVYGSIHPFGVSKSDGYISLYADDWADCLERLKAEWSKYSDEHKRQTIRDMALAIIRITSEFGICTDAALRSEFDPGTVALFGDDACDAANTMADKGPFTIKRMKGANAA